jgi:hypothetical protein
MKLKTPTQCIAMVQWLILPTTAKPEVLGSNTGYSMVFCVKNALKKQANKIFNVNSHENTADGRAATFFFNHTSFIESKYTGSNVQKKFYKKGFQQ